MVSSGSVVEPLVCESVPASEDASAALIVRVEWPAFGLFAQLCLRVRTERGCAVAAAVDDLLHSLVDKLDEDLEAVDEDLVAARDRLESVQRQGAAELVSWRNRLAHLEDVAKGKKHHVGCPPAEVEAAEARALRAEGTINSMRDAYFKELTHLREQLGQKNKASREGVEWQPSDAMHFDIARFLSDDEVSRLVRDHVSTMHAKYAAEVEVLTEELASEKVVTCQKDKALQFAARKLGAENVTSLSAALVDDDVDECIRSLELQVKKAASKAKRIVKKKFGAGAVRETAHLRFRKFLERKYGSLAIATEQLSARYNLDEHVDMAGFASFLNDLGYACNVPRCFAKLSVHRNQAPLRDLLACRPNVQEQSSSDENSGHSELDSEPTSLLQDRAFGHQGVAGSEAAICQSLASKPLVEKMVRKAADILLRPKAGFRVQSVSLRDSSALGDSEARSSSKREPLERSEFRDGSYSQGAHALPKPMALSCATWTGPPPMTVDRGTDCMEDLSFQSAATDISASDQNHVISMRRSKVAVVGTQTHATWSSKSKGLATMDRGTDSRSDVAVKHIGVNASMPPAGVPGQSPFDSQGGNAMPFDEVTELTCVSRHMDVARVTDGQRFSKPSFQQDDCTVSCDDQIYDHSTNSATKKGDSLARDSDDRQASKDNPPSPLVVKEGDRNAIPLKSIRRSSSSCSKQLFQPIVPQTVRSARGVGADKVARVLGKKKHKPQVEKEGSVEDLWHQLTVSDASETDTEQREGVSSPSLEVILPSVVNSEAEDGPTANQVQTGLMNCHEPPAAEELLLSPPSLVNSSRNQLEAVAERLSIEGRRSTLSMEARRSTNRSRSHDCHMNSDDHGPDISVLDVSQFRSTSAEERGTSSALAEHEDFVHHDAVLVSCWQQVTSLRKGLGRSAASPSRSCSRSPVHQEGKQGSSPASGDSSHPGGAARTVEQLLPSVARVLSRHGVPMHEPEALAPRVVPPPGRVPERHKPRRRNSSSFSSFSSPGGLQGGSRAPLWGSVFQSSDGGASESKSISLDLCCASATVGALDHLEQCVSRPESRQEKRAPPSRPTLPFLRPSLTGRAALHMASL